MTQAQAKTSVLAIVALITAFFCPPLSLILGVIALVRINKSQGQLTGSGLAIAALVIPLAMVPVIGILSAIAIPNFIRYQQRSKQLEAKTMLRAISSAQQQFFLDKNFYVAAALTPDSPPSAAKESWEARPCAEACGAEHPEACNELSCVGFESPGPVYFRYACSTGPKGDSLACAAMGDLDGDSGPSVFLLIVTGGKEALADPLPPQVQAACADALLVPGQVVECSKGQF